MTSPILKRQPFFLWFSLIIINLILILFVLAAPVIQVRWPKLSSAIYTAYAPFCHQIKERCFFLAGQPLAVCARCFGIMVGFLLSLIIYPLTGKITHFEPPGPSLLIGLSIPLFIDLAGNIFHLWSSPNWVRFILGSGWGFPLSLYFLPAAMNLWSKRAGIVKKEV